MSMIDKYRIVLAESDYILLLSECDDYEIHNDVLIKKNDTIPTLYDVKNFCMSIEEYVNTYPERNNYYNKLNQLTPPFRRTSST